MRRAVIPAVCALAVTLSGCGAVSVGRNDPSATSPPKTATSVSGTTSPDTTESSTTTDPRSPVATTTSQAIVTPDSAQAERKLTLADAFSKRGWTEADVTPAGKGEAVPAMQTSVTCYSGSAEVLEFRFAQGAGSLEADVAQAMASPSSAERLQFTANSDGRQVQVKTIPFAGTATLSVPLAGVTVVTISVQAAKTDASYTCEGAATALITRLVVVR